MKSRLLGAVCATLLAITSTFVHSATVYTQTSQGDYTRNVLGGSHWTGLTAEMNTQHTITFGADFSSLPILASFDAVWVDQELGDTLSGSEITALQQYISSGHRAVLFGENDFWIDWNASIMSVTGGDFIATCDFSIGAPISNNSIVDGITRVGNVCGSTLTSDGSPDVLFDNNFAAIYSIGSGEALVVLDTNWTDDDRLLSLDNLAFARNVVDWIGHPVPIPSAAYLFGSGLLGLVGIARKKAA